MKSFEYTYTYIRLGRGLQTVTLQIQENREDKVMFSIRQYYQRLPAISNRLQFSTDIVIAPRIERGPTDILAALAGTVGKDMTAPHYRYHDDPYLIPYKLGTKREFILSRESGKNAAQFIMSKHPDLFEHNRIEAEPPITAFQPRVAYNRDNVTVELLDNLGENLLL